MIETLLILTGMAVPIAFVARRDRLRREARRAARRPLANRYWTER